MTNCPQCGNELERIMQASPKMLNDEQYDAQKAGDWCCNKCPDNGRGHSKLCYFWDHELTP